MPYSDYQRTLRETARLAVQISDIDMLQDAIDAGIAGLTGWHDILRRAATSNLDIVKLLLANGVPPRYTRLDKQMTALLAACQQLGTMELLFFDDETQADRIAELYQIIDVLAAFYTDAELKFLVLDTPETYRYGLLYALKQRVTNESA